jgi:hypothetical protein
MPNHVNVAFSIPTSSHPGEGGTASFPGGGPSLGLIHKVAPNDLMKTGGGVSTGVDGRRAHGTDMTQLDSSGTVQPSSRDAPASTFPVQRSAEQYVRKGLQSPFRYERTKDVVADNFFRHADLSVSTSHRLSVRPLAEFAHG